MQNRSKLNLYDIQIAKTNIKAFAPRKSVLKIKIALFSLLALTSIISVGQSLITFDSKTSFANSSTQTSSISSSSSNKVTK